MPVHRPRLKRFALWAAAIMLLLAGYVLGAPFVAFFAQRYAPRSERVFVVIYAPLVYVARDPDAPGHSEFMAYIGWCEEMLDRSFDDS